MYKINHFKKKIISYLNSDKADEAWKIISNLSESDEKSIEYYLIVAEVLTEKNFYHESIKFLKKSLNLTSEKYNIYKNIGFNYMSLYEYEKALEYFTYAEGMMKSFDDILIYNIGLCLTTLGDIKYAETYFNKIIKTDPKNYLGYIGLSKVLRIQGHLNKAVEQLLQALELEQNSIYLLENLGNLYIETGNSQLAKNCFYKILELNSENVTAYHQLGVIEYEKNNFSDALKYYKKVIKLSPEMYETYQEIGWVYYLTGDINRSLKYLKKSLAINPDNIYAEIDYAAVCFAAGFITKAINLWKKVLKKQPENVMAINYLKQAENFKKEFGNYLPEMWYDQRNKGGFCHCGSGKRIRDCCLKEIDLTGNLINLTDFKKNLSRKNPGNLKKKKYNQYLINGVELLNSGQYEQALIEFEKSKDINEKDINLYHFLAKNYFLLKNYSKAFYMIEKSFEMDDSNTKTYFLLGDIYQKLSLFDNALSTYQFIINNFKQKLSFNELSDLHNNIGTIYFQMNDYNKAGIEWKKSLSLNKANKKAKQNLNMIKMMT